MLKNLIIPILISILIAPSAANNNEGQLRPSQNSTIANRNVDLSKIKIGGIGIGMTEQEVIKKFGRTQKIKVIDNKNNCYKKLWIYQGIDISLNNKGVVIGVSTDSPLYKTSEGVAVGNIIPKINIWLIYPQIQWHRVNMTYDALQEHTYLVMDVDDNQKITGIGIFTYSDLCGLQ